MAARMLGDGVRAFASAIAFVVIAVAGCTQSGREPGRAPAASGRAPLTATALVEEPVCRPTGAHGAHATLPRGCETCHACGGDYGFPQDLVMPRGTTTAGGVMSRTPGSPTTCSVGCHNPFGAPPSIVAWTQGGPLACASCHAQAVSAQARSAHAVAGPDPVTERAGCQACHLLSRHLSGTVVISLGDGTSVEAQPNDPAQLDAACTSCHDGSGKAVGGRTPPLLAGWTAPAGDFHGARAGTGYGGTLEAPYARGQAALPCRACHATHASQNAFLLAATVNGAPVPALSIDRQGVGAQALCESCHEGPRHAGCIQCHGTDPMPAGAACFFCHGHEGIKSFVWPSPTHDTKHPNASCGHCHSDWMPGIDRVAPVLATGGLVVVRNVTATGATIEWDTDEPATSYVEWGVDAPGNVTGSDALVKRHSVALAGLAEGQVYVLRVRSSDAFRNVTVSPLSTLATANAHAPPAPAPFDQPNQWVCDATAPVVLAWNPVADPDGDPVEYRVVLDDGVAFDSPRADSGWIAGNTFATSIPATSPPTYYYWRVQARDAAHDLASPWSPVDSFAGVLLDPSDCY